MKNEKTLSPRSPIVAVLGHVDHGKTTLLSKIREEDLTRKEAGGITQSIGAWQVRGITFIDTPGHEAFQAMRSRGAQIADIVVLVVAADDGVMPQTRESLQYIRETQTPFLVAITKIDLKTANSESVKNQLEGEGVLLEDRGGDIVSVEVSGITGQGIDELLEMILLLSEINEVSGDARDNLEAPVIETELSSRRGPVVRVVVRDGTLRVGEEVSAGGYRVKIRGLFDQQQKPLKEALPGEPAEILGFSELPAVGSVVRAIDQEEKPVPPKQRQIGKIEGFPIVLKADTAGSLEALSEQLEGKVVFLGKGLGDISESDVILASPAQASIIGFNVRVSKEVRKIAEEEGVAVHIYKIIYELLNEVESWAKEREEAGKDKILGRAEIVAEFPSGKRRIAGGKVIQGRVSKTDNMRLLRGEEILGRIRPSSMKKQKEKVNEAGQGEEFGLLFEPQFDFRPGDVIESFMPAKRQSSAR